MIWFAQGPGMTATPAGNPATWWWLLGIAVVALVAWWLWSPRRREARAGGRDRGDRKDGNDAG